VRHSIRRGLVLAALAGTALVATAPAAFAQTTSPEAFGIEGTGALGIPPTPDATLAHPNPAQASAINIPLLLSTGVLNASVTTNSATASVASLGNPTGIGIPLLGAVSAGLISSSCLSNADGTFSETSNIANLTLLGSPVTIPGTIPPNDNITALVPGLSLVANVTLNFQEPGPITGSQSVDAIHIALLGSAEVINIASSTCGPFSADTPIAGGKGLAVGLGLLGSVGVGYGAIYTRRRRISVI
jgi:hypothetical protein